MALQDGLTPPATVVAAAPTDTFVRTDAGAQLDQLARGLSTLHSGVAALTANITKQGTDEDTTAGAQAAREAQSRNIKSYADAIKAGIIDPSKSPFYQAAAQEQFGRVAAGQMDADAFVSATQDPLLQTSTNPEDYNAWRNKFQKDWLESHVGPEAGGANFQTGFGHANDVYAQDGRNKFAEIANQRHQQNVADMGFLESKVALARQLDIDAPPGVTWTPEQRRGMAAEQITALGRITRNANPLGARTFFENAAKAIAAEAIERGDLSVLDTMKSVQMGSGTLDSTSYGAATYIAAKRTILSNEADAQRLAHEKHNEEVSKLTDTLVSGAAAGFIANPNYDGKKEISQAQQAGDWEAIGKIQGMGDSFRKHDYNDNSNTYASLVRRIYDVNDGEQATSMKDLGEALANRQLTPETFKTLATALTTEEASGGAGKKYSNDPDLKEGKASVKAIFKNDFGEFNPEVANRADKAQDDFTNQYITWRQSPEGQKATSAQVQAFIQKQKDASVNKYLTVGPLQDRSKMPTPENIGETNVPNWHTSLVTGHDVIGSMKQDWTAHQGSKHTALSKLTVQIFQHAGLDPRSPTFAKDAQEFIDTQTRLAGIQ